MKKDMIEQATQTLKNELSKTQKTKEVIEKMVEALNDHRIDDIGEFFENNFNWFGNFGCGTKIGLKEFQQNWQVPFQKAFSENVEKCRNGMPKSKETKCKDDSVKKRQGIRTPHRYPHPYIIFYVQCSLPVISEHTLKRM